MNKAEEALIRLVKLKDYKDLNGKDEYYEKEKAEAWENARAVVFNLLGEYDIKGRKYNPLIDIKINRKQKYQ